MRTEPSTVDAMRRPVRFAMKAEHVTAERPSGLKFKNVDIDVQGESADEVRALMREFWSRLEGSSEMPGAKAGKRGADAAAADVAAIREAMRDQDINQAKLAERAGIRPSHVSMILGGRIGLSPANRRKFFDVLGIAHRKDS